MKEVDRLRTTSTIGIQTCETVEIQRPLGRFKSLGLAWRFLLVIHTRIDSTQIGRHAFRLRAMKKIAPPLLVVFVFGLQSVLSNALGAQATSKVVGAWEIRCEKFAEFPSEACALVQTVNSEDNPSVHLSIIILKMSSSNTAEIRAIAPSGVFLLRGVNLRIDQTDAVMIPFYRCPPGACISAAPLNEKLLEQLKNGKIAPAVIYVEPQEGLRHQFKLEGFREAYESLR